MATTHNKTAITIQGKKFILDVNNRLRPLFAADEVQVGDIFVWAETTRQELVPSALTGGLEDEGCEGEWDWDVQGHTVTYTVTEADKAPFLVEIVVDVYGGDSQAIIFGWEGRKNGEPMMRIDYDRNVTWTTFQSEVKPWEPSEYIISDLEKEAENALYFPFKTSKVNNHFEEYAEVLGWEYIGGCIFRPTKPEGWESPIVAMNWFSVLGNKYFFPQTDVDMAKLRYDLRYMPITGTGSASSRDASFDSFEMAVERAIKSLKYSNRYWDGLI